MWLTVKETKMQTEKCKNKNCEKNIFKKNVKNIMLAFYKKYLDL